MTDPVKGKVTVDVEASAVWLSSEGEQLREVTEDDLHAQGWRHDKWLSQRIDKLARDAGINLSQNGGATLRYFLEYIFMYDHDPDPGSFSLLARWSRGEQI